MSHEADPYEVLQQLRAGRLLTILTIPGEEWTLSCARHPELLVEVFTLKGSIVTPKGSYPRTWRCGRLAELLLKLLWVGRRVGYQAHAPKVEEGQRVTRLTSQRRRLADTFEEDANLRLRGGDLLFFATGSQWVLTNTYFGLSFFPGQGYHLARQDTMGTPHPCIYKSMSLERVLLSFVCQSHQWQESRQHTVLKLAFVQQPPPLPTTAEEGEA